MSSVNPGPPAEPAQPAGERLESWKEIAAYLKRDIRTVERWEKLENLPVHRHLHSKRGTVWAYQSELELWWSTRQAAAERPQKERTWPRRHARWLAAGGVILAVGAGLVIWRRREPGPPDLATRRVWSGPDVDRLGTVSPDGRYLAFVDPATSDVAVRDLATGTQRRLTNKNTPTPTGGTAEFPSISPDGRQVAYAWFNQDLFYELRLVGMDGSGERVVFRNPEVFLIQPGGWSSDGAQILARFHRREDTSQIVLVRVVDGSVQVLKTLGWREPTLPQMSLSPDGRYVVYDFPPGQDSPDRNIYLLEAAGGGREIPLVEHRGTNLVLGWTPDGTTVLFAGDRTGTRDAWAIRVTGGKPHGEPVLIKKDLGLVWPVGFTQKGSYYYGLQTRMTDVYVAELDPATGKLLRAPAPSTRRFVGYNRTPDWSPDGRYLAYAPERRRYMPWWGARVILRSAETQEERDLWPKLNSVEVIRWSPDGRSLLVSGHDHRDRMGLYDVDIHTGAVVPIVQGSEPGAFYHHHAQSPDGKTIFYKLRDTGVEPSRLLVLHRATGREEEFLPSVYRFDLSPDGKQLAFSTFDDRQEYLRILPATGGAARDVYRHPRGTGRIVSVAWTPEGRWLLFAQRGKLWRIAAAGGEPEKLELAMDDLRDLRAHPDGRRLAFTAGTGRGEVWVMENFLPGR